MRDSEKAPAIPPARKPGGKAAEFLKSRKMASSNRDCRAAGQAAERCALGGYLNTINH
jgi:hypothetical protein